MSKKSDDKKDRAVEKEAIGLRAELRAVKAKRDDLRALRAACEELKKFISFTPRGLVKCTDPDTVWYEDFEAALERFEGAFEQAKESEDNDA